MQTQLIADRRLRNHHLLEREELTPGSLVARMGAVQAQDFAMARWAIGIRLPGYTDAAVKDAFDRGEILRTHVLRPTWHFVAPENIRWMLMLSADRIKTSARSRDRELGISEALYHQAGRLMRKALEGNRQLTREALGRILVKAKIQLNPARMVHFLMRAEADAIICSGAMKGKVHTYALLEERVPHVRSIYREEALAMLARIYFSSHAPATLQDFVWWSGLNVSEAKSGLEAVRTELVAEKNGGQEYWMTGAAIDPPEAETSAHLLPAFDEYLIAYRDRKSVLELEYKSRAISSNGVFRPVILVNGVAVGTWKRPTPGQPRIGVSYFTPPDAPTDALVRQAAGEYRRFTGLSAPDP